MISAANIAQNLFNSRFQQQTQPQADEKSRRSGELLRHEPGSNTHNTLAVCAAIKLYFCDKNERLFKVAPVKDLARYTGLDEETTLQILITISANDFYLTVNDGKVVSINNRANLFQTFKVFSKDSKRLLKECRKAAYQDQTDFPRLPRFRVHNDTKLVVKKSDEHTLGANVGTGNRCGHNPNIKPTFEFSEKDKKRPNSVALFVKKISDAFTNRDLFPELKFARDVKPDKFGRIRNQRTDGLEPCILLMAAMAAFCDILTMRVGKPPTKQDPAFHGIRIQDLAKIAGISFTRAEEAMAVWNNTPFVKTIEVCEKQEDGTYKGYAAIRTLSPLLWKRLGLGDILKKDRAYLYQQQLKREWEAKNPGRKYESNEDRAKRIEDEFNLAAELTEHAPQHISKFLTSDLMPGRAF